MLIFKIFLIAVITTVSTAIILAIADTITQFKK